MITIALGAVLVYGWIRWLERTPPALVCMIVALAALLNTLLQPHLPGTQGIGASLLLSTVGLIALTKGVTR